MSTPILPFAVWQSGTNQNSIPANDNSLRNQILNGLVIGVEDDAPGGDVDGDIYIVGDTPAGAFASFDEFDLAIFDSGTWYAFAPVDGIIVNIAGAANTWNGSAYVAVTTGGGGTGDFSGPASSTDNALVRFDGTGGKTGQNSGVVVTDDNEISGYRANRNAQVGTTYTLQASDSGKVVELTNGSAVTVTLPNSLSVGFCCTIVQGGAGQVTLSAASGASLRNRQSHTKTAGQWAGATLYVRTNSGGSAAEYVLNGDTSA